MNRFFSLALVLVSICSYAQSELTDQQLMEYVSTVSKEKIKHHIAVLADDSMRGRYPGTPEYLTAMNYVADQFKSMGFKPLGDNMGTSYFQPLTLRKALVIDNQSFMILNESDTLLLGEDYFYAGNANNANEEFSAEVVFAGYGIDAPGLGYNDFDQVDVKGKIMIILRGGPEDFQASERAYFSSTDTKLQTAIDKGAVGILNVRENVSRIHSYLKTRGVTNVVLPSGKAIGRSSFEGNLQMGGYINQSILEKMIGKPYEEIIANYIQGTILNPENPQILSGTVVARYEEIESGNVVGLYEGGDKKDEYIVHTAHLDHLGVGKLVAGDSIYNGAHDNASGISSMLEIAGLYSKLETKPKRSVIFLAVTAEEMGLLGSRYYAEYPTVDMHKIVANVNTDMPTLVAPLLSIEPLGAEHSSLMNQVERTAKLFDLRVDEDHMPEEVRFVRSDQVSFVKKGVPALNISYGLKATNPEETIDSLITNFRNNHYHKPSDELNDSFDWDAAVKFVQMHFVNSYMINTDEERPTWNEGDFFGTFRR